MKTSIFDGEWSVWGAEAVDVDEVCPRAADALNPTAQPSNKTRPK